MKQSNYEKFQLRGAIKELMRNCNLRTISVNNYAKWAFKNLKDFNQLSNVQQCLENNVHSIRYDIMNGYIKVYGFGSNERAGEPFGTVNNDIYAMIYNTIMDMVELNIPSKIKKNILVKVNR